MIRAFAGVLLALMFAVAHADTSGQKLAETAGRSLIDQPAPRLVLTTIDGAKVDLGALYGRKAVYLKFWATWCTPCREQMPHFEHAYEASGPELAVIAVNIGFNDTLADVQAYRRAMHIEMPIVIDDGQLANALHLRVTPQHIVIGRNGRVLYVGHLADSKLDAALEAARTVGVPAPTDDMTQAVSEAPPAHLEVGDLLPDEWRRTLAGGKFTFHDPQRSRPTVLVFLSPWCESYLATTRPATSAACRTMRLQTDRLAGDPTLHVRWLGIASGLWASRRDLAIYQRQLHVQIPLTLDDSGRDFREFQVKRVPTALIADDRGRIVRRVESDELSTPTLRAVLGAL
jgi:thiol-disulfide isomerase/thioredoxin